MASLHRSGKFTANVPVISGRSFAQYVRSGTHHIDGRVPPAVAGAGMHIAGLFGRNLIFLTPDGSCCARLSCRGIPLEVALQVII